MSVAIEKETAISSKEVECIDSYLIDGYTVEDSDFPNVLCTDFHFELKKKNQQQ